MGFSTGTAATVGPVFLTHKFKRAMTFEFEQKSKCTCIVDGKVHDYYMAGSRSNSYSDVPVGERLELIGKGCVYTVNGVVQKGASKEMYFFKLKK